jgi:hypothetical protein
MNYTETVNEAIIVVIISVLLQRVITRGTLLIGFKIVTKSVVDIIGIYRPPDGQH